MTIRYYRMHFIRTRTIMQLGHLRGNALFSPQMEIIVFSSYLKNVLTNYIVILKDFLNVKLHFQIS